MSQVEIFKALCKNTGLPEPIPEFRFHPKRRWRIDFYFEANGIKLGLEVEGGAWSGGRHTRGSGFVKDIEKYNAMTMQGIFLMRVTPSELNTIKTTLEIKATLKL